MIFVGTVKLSVELQLIIISTQMFFLTFPARKISDLISHK